MQNSAQRDQSTPASGFQLLSFLLFFVFGGAIVGETVAVSIVVSVSGMATLGQLFIINGLVLFGLPVFFFKLIDRYRRERLLADQLLVTVALLFAYVAVFSFRGSMPPGVAHTMLMVIYPLSYLSKTINFLTFWTLANDICDTGEAKKSFPVVAAWGFAGGLIGSFVAWALLRTVDIQTLIWLWMFLYLTAWVLVKKIRGQFWQRLLRTETVHVRRERLLPMVRDVLRIPLVRVMGVIYFLVFVGVFSLDFLFWQQCHRWFSTSNSLASFQFSFYLAHAMVTIGALYLVLPGLIARWGFVKVMYALPTILLAGAATLLAVRGAGVEARLVFAGTIVFQFLRYVVFENAFSPIYQMFFVAVPAERRGRAKTVLEGVVKPLALICSGLYLSTWGDSEMVVLSVVLVTAALLVHLVFVVRRTYIRELVPRRAEVETAAGIMAQMGSAADSKIVSLVEEYAVSRDPDLRSIAARLLAHQVSRQSLVRLREMWDAEREDQVRQVIARSLGDYYWFETREFVELMLVDSSVRVRANALYSLTEMNARWKWELRARVGEMLFDSSLRVQIEAARFLWSSHSEEDRQAVQKLLNQLLASRNPDKRSAGLYLVGVLQPENWEMILLRNLATEEPGQVFGKSVETILRYASDDTRMQALEAIEGLSREQIALAGKAAESVGEAVVPVVLRFLSQPRGQRVSFQLVHALRVIKYHTGGEPLAFDIDLRTERNVLRWIVRELRSVYTDAAVWARFQHESPGGNREAVSLLESALRERVIRVAGWALDALVLIDREGLITWGRRDLDIRDYGSRLDMIEILESLGSHRIGALTVPLLKFESWEAVARSGRFFVRRFGDDGSGGLAHFLRAENRWVCVAALYALRRTVTPEKILEGYRATLDKLSRDPFKYVSSAAAELLGSGDAPKEGTVQTFQLLETVLFLKQTPLFRNVPGERLMAVAEICVQKAYEKGTVISREGELSDHLYVVKRGSIRIVRGDGPAQRELTVLGPLQTYGEIGMLSQSQRSASAVANEDCELFAIQRSALRRLLLKMPELTYNLLEIFSEKLRKSGGDVVVATETAGVR